MSNIKNYPTPKDNTLTCRFVNSIRFRVSASGDQLRNMSLGCVGEFGEVVEELKKFIFHDKKPTRESFVNELGDYAFYSCAYGMLKNVSYDYIQTSLHGFYDCRNIFTALHIMQGNEFDKIRAATCLLEVINYETDFNITMEEVLEYNIKKLEARYPNGKA